jgi:hypothetical protein
MGFLGVKERFLALFDLLMLPVNEHSFSKKGKFGKHTKERTGEASP